MSHVVFRITFEPSGSTLITGHDPSSWTIITATLRPLIRSEVAQVMLRLGAFDLSDLLNNKRIKELMKLCCFINCFFKMVCGLPLRLNITGEILVD